MGEYDLLCWFDYYRSHDIRLKNKGILLFVLVILLCVQAGNVYAVRATPGRFDHFALQLPGKILAGEDINIKVLAQDYHNNLILNFKESGRAFNVSVSTPANVRLIHLDPDSFQGGVASLNISVTKADKFTLYIHEVNEPTAVFIKEVVIVPDKSDNSLVLAPDKVSAEKIQEPEKKTQETQKLTSDKAKGEGGIKKSVAAGKKQKGLNKTVIPQTTTSVPAVKETRNKKAQKIQKTETAQKGRLFNIADVSLMETDGRGLLLISGDSSTGPANYKYKKSIEKRQGREWLRVSISPAIRKTSDTVKLKSELIGEIVLEEDRKEKDTVNIYIELKAKKPFYDISEQKNGLAVMLSKAKFLTERIVESR